MSRARPVILVALAALQLAGCANALYTRSRQRVGQAVVLSGQELLGGDTTKARVLARLGAPRHVLSQPEGDLFIYALEQLDIDTFALRNPSGASAAVFQYATGLNQEHSLFCWFDRDGQLVEASRAVARRSR